MENLLTIRNLNVNFKTPRGRVYALRDINIDATANRILGIRRKVERWSIDRW